jgi:hypothetical protein
MQELLRGCQGVHGFRERELADDHDVDVAARTLVPARQGPVDERCGDPVGHGFERFAQDVGDARGLFQHVAQVLVDGRPRVRLEVHLVADRAAGEQPGIGQLVQLPQERPGYLAGNPGDLPHMERRFGMQQEQRESVAPVSAEEE